MTRTEFKLPDIGEGIAEAELVEWLVEVGDEVREDQPVAAVMTDKATVELEAPVTGRIVERTASVGEVLRVGKVLLVFESEGAAAEEPREAKAEKVAEAPEPEPEPTPAPEPEAQRQAPPPPAPTPSSGKVLASPLARRRAHDLGIDLAAVPHEGERVLNTDLDAFMLAQASPARAQGHVEPERGTPPRAVSSALRDEEIPVAGMRRIIAQKMAESKRNIPHFTYVEEIDMTELERLRAELNSPGPDGNERAHRLTLLPLLIAAICRCLPRFPQMNAHYYDDSQVVRRFGQVHMGIAAQTDAGLMVPVIREAETLSLDQLAAKLAQRADEARRGTIARDDLRGSTITVTSLGKLGGIAATPILNRPEVCIIGPNKIVTRPVWQDGAFVPRQMMNLSISCDHRVIDGYDAAAFVQELKRRLEMPALIFTGD